MMYFDLQSERVTIMTSDIDDIVIQAMPTGSSVICNPPVLDTDRDFLVLVKGTADEVIDCLTSRGYTADGGGTYDSQKELDQGGFISFRKDTTNYIVVSTKDAYRRFALATELATKMNLVKKEDRITVFKWFREEAIL